jgi:hypothetical protein
VMPTRRKTGIDVAASVLALHVRAVAERQRHSETAELSADDLSSIVRAAEILRAIECGRMSLLLKVLGRRLTTMKLDDLKDFVAETLGGEITGEGEHAV